MFVHEKGIILTAQNREEWLDDIFLVKMGGYVIELIQSTDEYSALCTVGEPTYHRRVCKCTLEQCTGAISESVAHLLQIVLDRQGSVILLSKRLCRKSIVNNKW